MAMVDHFRFVRHDFVHVVKSPVLSLSQSIFSFYYLPMDTRTYCQGLPTSFHPYLISLALSYSTIFRHIPFLSHMTHG